ncbi:hypothetical protein AN944_00287 [Shewanella sp. P1-14-1]|uniref:hypothetical protein n=1 Tax=Shewanella sp. P1-14-1 TaxID=1723761 RepID=UPI0006D67C9E|nr:hypothetical protein [Shewanella sp. P1-14-1]KPZ73139.1 hypothetical protein AN944_00287 [Shewanella sp. P1-14-1]
MVFKKILLLMLLIPPVYAGNTIFIFNKSLPLYDGVEIRPILDSEGISSVRGYVGNSSAEFNVTNDHDGCDDSINPVYTKNHILDDDYVIFEKKITIKINEELVVDNFILTDCKVSVQFFDNDTMLQRWLGVLKRK